ncbi:similar to Saccharomyces cerevisiae YGR170W PSD2 Phosphatidylserine decarboxylase of the Golgi and vacuolar membranes, converts phosphatidylserine to phosphatidylethanolamine [Maudiozyma barnettii]|uniref:Phosphatidylserine decarboxylase proenzyme 2 n=1 Tax=Maudiozyma barnettii TaxID=61262 RepID=A0A8H2VH27_9SACH|nr:phosphatidylserine decarboxylase 2 [Kazachstania barnettii]CAB4255280.1 similar to Saccharomyces cerevisiae YGR170W PSD2 Phosphatidylserine decarboxylase of the Golgi and vacuolar membranes, converts phosphatidylserine to phosphatidylethanolamine [Kazachstania barnettii]CAD1783687.1 similar to Saccharomyces cerevisiae YGR170W PSD2 Phosphatidylserine decarboxylase of the Golgi and vacuolar membranes, converts phosphatidylserine to phosphatidylethanolamine [Kazachstania barnettii]
MRIIPGKRQKKKDAKQLTLNLAVRISYAKHIDLIDNFQCNPICFVTTNTFYTKRTAKLKNSNTHWNQILKLKLPRTPQSDLLRVIVFDALPTMAPTTTAGTPPLSNASSVTSMASLSSPFGSTSQQLHARSSTTLATSLGTATGVSAAITTTATTDLHDSIDSIQHFSSEADHLNIQHSYSNQSLDHSNQDHYKRHVTSNYLYIGEVQLSLLDLFKKKDSKNSYNFSLAPEWYTLYDKKREKEQHDSGVNIKYPVGEIYLGFHLTTNDKSFSTIEAYNSWRNMLFNSMSTPVTYPKGKSNGKLQEREQLRTRSRTISDPRLESLNVMKMCEIPPSAVTDSELGPLLSQSRIRSQSSSSSSSGSSSCSSVSSYDSYETKPYMASSESNINDVSMEGLIENFELLSDVIASPDSEEQPMNDTHNINNIDLASIASVLDEYEVVLPEEINHSKIPNIDLLLNGDMIPEVEEAIDIDDDDILGENGIEENRMYKIRDKANSAISFSSENIDKGYEDDDEKSMSGEDSSENDDQSNDRNGLIFRPTVKKLIRMRRSTKSYKERITRKVETTFQVSKKQHSLGVMYTEFVSITGLPPLKSKLSRTFDMDPFIVASFGRKVFKTSWKKHTLNPIFGESAAFEVFPYEKNFSFHFKVLDKDSFTFNDEVAEYDLSWADMIEKLENKYPSKWTNFDLPMKLLMKKNFGKYTQPVLHLRMRFMPYMTLKNTFWKYAVLRSTIKQNFDMCDLMLFLDKLGSFTDKDVLEFFARFSKNPWSGDFITKVQLIEGLQNWKKSAEFKNVWRCPKCFRSRKKSNNVLKSKLMIENDLITHFAICSFSHANKTLKPSYVSSEFASKRWFSKVLIKLTYGKYALGSNNANILVQDRGTGIIIEEKISAHVKFGMRIIYNGRGTETKKFKTLLKNMSIRQGKKFDDPASIKQIEPFIKFHSLDTSQCLDMEYKTFNEFFYRKLKPGSRTIEGGDSRIMVSCADSRCTVFDTIAKSKEIWIKGSKFSIDKLTGDYELDKSNEKNTSIAIFRLAPQDYHRFHSPCDGVIGKPVYIDGEYYTVNPMAIRSGLDVFGENIRVVIPIHSKEFGTFLFIPVGAMMVGSIILTCKEGDSVRRGEELGYFKFGGSTIILIVPKGMIQFDSDISKNSREGIETLVKVGMSVGHSPAIKEYKRKAIRVVDPTQLERIKRTISVDEEHANKYHNVTWEYKELEKFMNQDYGEEDVESKITDIDSPY